MTMVYYDEKNPTIQGKVIANSAKWATWQYYYQLRHLSMKERPEHDWTWGKISLRNFRRLCSGWHWWVPRFMLPSSPPSLLKTITLNTPWLTRWRNAPCPSQQQPSIAYAPLFNWFWFSVSLDFLIICTRLRLIYRGSFDHAYYSCMVDIYIIFGLIVWVITSYIFWLTRQKSIIIF